jgi:hypothetical protein
MKTSNIRRTLSAALAGLAFAAITQVSDAAYEAQVAGLTETGQSTSANAIQEPRHAGSGSPLTLYMEDPNGNAFRLVRIDGSGWKYVEGWKSPERTTNSLFRKMAFWSTTPAPVAKEAVTNDEPLTVLIDGPSGFAFVWNRDDGWKFVGKITDKRP